MKTPSAALAAVIRAAVEASNLTQQEVADAIGLPKATFNRKYHGHKAYGYDELVAIADLLGTTLEALHQEATSAAA
jgi:transcriptional regulator with XRE-family HTH domain